MQELKQAITKTQVRKQSGPNEVFYDYIKKLELHAFKVLLTIYNKFWTSKHIYYQPE